MSCGDEKADGSRLAGGSRDESTPLQGQDHLVDGRGRDSEVLLHVRFRRRATMDLEIVVNKS